MDLDDLESNDYLLREQACKLTFCDCLDYIIGLLLFLFVLHMLIASWHG